MRLLLELVVLFGIPVAVFASMVAFVVFTNRALGRQFDEVARRLVPLVAQEGIVFAEDHVRTRQRWLAPFAFKVRWTHVDLRVTRRAIYLFQYVRLPFGAGRMGQPVLAMPAPGCALDPDVRPCVRAAQLTAAPSFEDGALVLVGVLGSQRFRMTLAVRGGATLAAKLNPPPGDLPFR